MKGLVIVLVVVPITSGVLGSRATRSRGRRGGWGLQERSDAGAVRLLAVRAGEPPLELGAVPAAAEDFDSRL